MAKVKHTKTALKAERDALRRFERYLPTLQLKKQQLQMEIRQLEAKREEKDLQERRLREELAAWMKLFSEGGDLDRYIRIGTIRTSEGNIAGVAIPVLEEIPVAKSVPNLSVTPSWYDDGVLALEQLARLRIERKILDEQHRLLGDELRVTTQRVNLFEKVKIPECEENIRVIRIFLGDGQTADVVRGKIAKGRSVEKVRSA